MASVDRLWLRLPILARASLLGIAAAAVPAAGVNINDKQIEVIVRQMMRWVKIKDVERHQVLDRGMLVTRGICRVRS